MRCTKKIRLLLLCSILLSLSGLSLLAEDGSQAWLRYAPVNLAVAPPADLVLLDSNIVPRNASNEMQHGLFSMTHVKISISNGLPATNAIVLGTVPEIQEQFQNWHAPIGLHGDGYVICTMRSHHHRYLLIVGNSPRGILYGTFALLERFEEHPEGRTIYSYSSPSAPIRWVNQWDNLDGSIERGYAGRSIFFDHGYVRSDLTRAADYARLLASIGINGCTVNNVNADPHMLTPKMIAGLARIANAFRPWGVRLSISVDLSDPVILGGLKSFDPLDPQVIAWWQEKISAIYKQIPDFGGFTIKADSEGQPGPSQYGRSPAAAANMLAQILRPHGGVVMYRAFVYNHHLNWHDPKADRARAAYDIFHPLDGKFDDNVIVQIKNGPIDFQVREPASPLFAGLHHTNEAIELQITQEYTGQQRQLVYLVPMWKTTLDFDMHTENRYSPVKYILEGRTFHRSLGGYAGVANVGLDTNWLAHPLAMANLWGFGQLAWNPNRSAQEIAENWTRLTFGNNPKVVSTIDSMLLSSWNIYESYTGPLGLGTLTDILGSHYGPNPASAENNGWGQWIRADHNGVGMNRTVATGTSYIGQYPPRTAAQFESRATCPDDLLLFMHHVPYTYHLHNGSTVIQYLYDSHYRGAVEAQGLASAWSTLRGLVDTKRFDQVMALQTYQAGYAIVWRDAITRWFYQKSGIADQYQRVGHYPDRVASTAMQLDGYTPVQVAEWEAATNGVAVTCPRKSGCSASTLLHRSSGVYNIAVQYFDFHNGASQFQLLLNGRQIARWVADNNLPGNLLNTDTSTRYTANSISLKPGDRLTLNGYPDGIEPAPFDYIVIYPVSQQSDQHD